MKRKNRKYPDYRDLRVAECHSLISSDRRRFFHWKELLGFCHMPKKEEVFQKGDFLISTVERLPDGTLIFKDMDIVHGWTLIPTKYFDYYLTDFETGRIYGFFGDSTVLKFNQSAKTAASILFTLGERAQKRNLNKQGKEFMKDVD